MHRLLLLSLLCACHRDKHDHDTGGGDDSAPVNPDDSTAETGGGDSLLGPFLDGDCDPLVPEHCGFPFPSNVYLRADASTPTGARVAFGETTLPVSGAGIQSSPALLNQADGFSASVAPSTYFPGATDAGLTSPFTPEDSMLPDVTTVILDAETGERVMHFAELDMSQDDDRRALMLRPVARLADHTRYIVAVRGLVDEDGALLPASDAFAALRDGADSDEPSVDARRTLYEDIFTRLEEAGIDRADLQIAWDFTTSSRESNTAALLSMRDAALAALPEAGPTYTITSVTEDPNDQTSRIIEGNLTVPLYLDDGAPGGRLLLGDDGLPAQNGTYDYPFVVVIPKSCAGTPCPLLQFGHGLFGDRYTLTDSYQVMLNTYGTVGFAMDLIGMSGEDVGAIAGAAASGDIMKFATVPDRSQQGFLNMVLAMRMMMGPMVTDEHTLYDGAASIDPTQRAYLGGSQGGIYGATYMAIATDVERGVLGVPGMAYSLMLPRSVYWDSYAQPFIVSQFEDPLDVVLALGYIQMLWDHAEPSGYAPYITDNTLPGTPSHRVLLLEALGDHQVPNLSTELLARTIGASQLAPANNSHAGIPETEGPISAGNVMVDFDFGLPQVPEENVPLEEGEDSHGMVADLITAQLISYGFLIHGVVEQACDGPCDPE